MVTRYPFFASNMPLLVRIKPGFGRHVRLAGIDDHHLHRSWLTPPPPKEVQELVEHLRYPNLLGDTVVSELR